MQYSVQRTREKPQLAGDWDGDVWKRAEVAEIADFRPEGSDHTPKTQVKMLYDDGSVYALFRVEDRYVRSVETEYCGFVCKDCCQL